MDPFSNPGEIRPCPRRSRQPAPPGSRPTARMPARAPDRRPPRGRPARGKTASSTAFARRPRCRTRRTPARWPNACRRWIEHYQPEGPAAESLVEHAALASVRLRRCARVESARLALRQRYAQMSDEARRIEELDALVERLPAEPTLAAPLLRQRPEGCDWMIDRWLLLGASLRDRAGWTLAELFQALHLLGLSSDPQRRSPRLADRRVAPALWRSGRGRAHRRRHRHRAAATRLKRPDAAEVPPRGGRGRARLPEHRPGRDQRPDGRQRGRRPALCGGSSVGRSSACGP